MASSASTKTTTKDLRVYLKPLKMTKEKEQKSGPSSITSRRLSSVTQKKLKEKKKITTDTSTPKEDRKEEESLSDISEISLVSISSTSTVKSRKEEVEGSKAVGEELEELSAVLIVEETQEEGEIIEKVTEEVEKVTEEVIEENKEETEEVKTEEVKEVTEEEQVTTEEVEEITEENEDKKKKEDNSNSTKRTRKAGGKKKETDEKEIQDLETIERSKGKGLSRSTQYKEIERIRKEISKYLKNTTRIPATSKAVLESHLDAIEAQIFSLEIETIQAKAKEEIATELLREFVEKREAKTKVKEVASSVSEATTTVIINPTDEKRTPREVREQLQGLNIEKDITVEKVKETRQGLAVQVASTSEADKLKRRLASNPASKDTLQYYQPDITRKKLILFHVPAGVTAFDIERKIGTLLGASDATRVVSVQRPFPASANTNHWPILVPRNVGNHLLELRSVYIGFKACPIKNFIDNKRCYRCHLLGHIAKECKNREYCGHCSSQDHKTEACENQKKTCRNCVAFNMGHHGFRGKWERMKTTHSSLDKDCKTFKIFMRLRQIQAEETGRSPTITAEDVYEGRVALREPLEKETRRPPFQEPHPPQRRTLLPTPRYQGRQDARYDQGFYQEEYHQRNYY